MKPIKFFSDKSNELKNRLNKLNFDESITFDFEASPEKEELNQIAIQLQLMFSEFDNKFFFDKFNEELNGQLIQYNSSLKKKCLFEIIDLFIDFIREYRSNS